MKNSFTNQQDQFGESTSREKVLKKVRHALLEPSDNPFKDLDLESAVFAKMPEEKDIQFAMEFSKKGDSFIYCKSPNDMLMKVKALFHENNWKEAWCNDELLTGLLNHAGITTYTGTLDQGFYKIAVTSCECLIARTGSIIISSGLESGRKLPFAADIHIVIAFTSQVVEDVKQGLEFIKNKYRNGLPSMVSIISGSSRSDDVEKTMVSGGHGPLELFVFMADEDNADK